jgi:hypothetical protein
VARSRERAAAESRKALVAQGGRLTTRSMAILRAGASFCRSFKSRVRIKPICRAMYVSRPFNAPKASPCILRNLAGSGNGLERAPA